MYRFAVAVAGALLLGGAAPVFAGDTTTFGQFFQKDSSQRLLRYRNDDTGSSKGATIYSTSSTASTAAGSVPIYFLLSADSLWTDLTGPQDAHMTVSFASNVGTTGSGSDRSQLFGTGSIVITRDTAALEGLNSRTNLLTVTFSDADLDASNGSGAFTFESTATSMISYTSDFLDFSDIDAQDFSFSFSGSSPNFQAALGWSSVDTRFSGTGTFASDPAPLTVGVPEASSWAMLVLGFGTVGAVMRAGRRQKDLFAA